MTENEALDLAIIGLGPSGLYTAWRIATASPDNRVLDRAVKELRVGLFDTMAEDRIGGRLCTQPLPGHPFLTELGGMRYRHKQHLVKGIVKELGLGSQVKKFDFNQHFYYLRGRRLTEAVLRSDYPDHPYRLQDAEKKRLPAELIRDAIHNTLKSLQFGASFFGARETAYWGGDSEKILDALQSPDGLETLSEREWALVTRYGQYRLAHLPYNVGFWDLLQFQLSSEGWHFAHDGLGYESIMGNWNAAVALPWFLSDFASSEASTLEEGMSSIPTALYNVVKNSPHYSCHFGWDLTGVDLANTDAGNNLVKLDFTAGVTKETIFARSVVLALPKGALIRLAYGDRLADDVIHPLGRNLEPRTWLLDQLNSVEGRPLFKLFLGYSSPWWAQDSNMVTGKVNTDLPLRQIYYYGRDQWNKKRATALGLSGEEQYSMIMASYSDSHYIEFWSELGKPADWAHIGMEGGKNTLLIEDREVLERYGAPRSMIVRAEHQLGLLHGSTVLRGPAQPRANLGLYMEWSRPPYYAGWHSWKVGVKPWEVCDYIMKPFKNARVAICGEAYSDEQGWTEGAFKSAERLLQSPTFKLPLPSGILQDEFDGEETQLKRYIGMLD